jgi:hypothetical protein
MSSTRSSARAAPSTASAGKRFAPTHQSPGRRPPSTKDRGSGDPTQTTHTGVFEHHPFSRKKTAAAERAGSRALSESTPRVGGLARGRGQRRRGKGRADSYLYTHSRGRLVQKLGKEVLKKKKKDVLWSQWRLEWALCFKGACRAELHALPRRNARVFKEDDGFVEGRAVFRRRCWLARFRTSARQRG